MTQYDDHCLILLAGHVWRIKFVFHAAMSLENACGCFPGGNCVLDIKDDNMNWDLYCDHAVATMILEQEAQLVDQSQNWHNEHESRTLH